ncbi:MAG: ADP-ribosylation factor GTPase-activating protein [Vampirovibrio sp.]|jgi:hypothetical protein|nr:ADP-ribosylation factor GTPase-activating protein [Vampirovibrio sp.]
MLNLITPVKPANYRSLAGDKSQAIQQSLLPATSKRAIVFSGFSQPFLQTRPQNNGYADIFFRSGVPSPTPSYSPVTTPATSIPTVQNVLPNSLTKAIVAGDTQTFQAILANQPGIAESICQWAAGCGQPHMLELLFNKTSPPITPVRQAQWRVLALSQQAKVLQYKTWERHQRTQALFEQLMEACIDNSALTECMALLSAGVELNAKGAEGNTPLHTAASLENPQAVLMLLQAGANVNLTNDSGSTPLHLAAATGDAESVQLLLATGANPQAMDREWDTPLKRAMRSGDQKTIDLLKSITGPSAFFYSPSLQ